MPADWIQVVSSVGFPIAVASYLLFRMERIMTELRDAILALTAAARAANRPPGRVD